MIGAGGVAQVEHIPNLLRLPVLFDLEVVADPSPSARAFVSGRYAVPTVADPAELLAMPLDAVVIASPDALHFAHVSAALGAGPARLLREAALLCRPRISKSWPAARQGGSRPPDRLHEALRPEL